MAYVQLWHFCRVIYVYLSLLLTHFHLICCFVFCIGSIKWDLVFPLSLCSKFIRRLLGSYLAKGWYPFLFPRWNFGFISTYSGLTVAYVKANYKRGVVQLFSILRPVLFVGVRLHNGVLISLVTCLWHRVFFIELWYLWLYLILIVTFHDHKGKR